MHRPLGYSARGLAPHTARAAPFRGPARVTLPAQHASGAQLGVWLLLQLPCLSDSKKNTLTTLAFSAIPEIAEVTTGLKSTAAPRWAVRCSETAQARDADPSVGSCQHLTWLSRSFRSKLFQDGECLNTSVQLPDLWVKTLLVQVFPVGRSVLCFVQNRTGAG